MSRQNEIVAHIASRQSQIIQNKYIRYGCVGINLSVFLAWQYARRDGSTPLADPTIWAMLDRQLPRGIHQRVSAFMQNNFILNLGDQRVDGKTTLSLRPWALITSAFSHVDGWHLLGNLAGFNSFFTALSILLSPAQMGGLVIGTAAAGSAAFLEQQKRRPYSRRHRALGASGVVAGLSMAAAVLFPRARSSYLGFNLPLYVVVACYNAWDWFLLDSEISTTGHAAHLGGAMAGLAYGLCLRYFNLVGVPPWRLR